MKLLPEARTNDHLKSLASHQSIRLNQKGPYRLEAQPLQLTGRGLTPNHTTDPAGLVLPRGPEGLQDGGQTWR